MKSGRHPWPPGATVITFLVALSSFMGLGVVGPILPFLALELDLTTWTIPLILMIEPLMMALFAPLCGRQGDRLGRRRVLLPLLAAGPLGALMLMLADGLTLFLLSRVMAGLSHGAFGVIQAALADRTTKHQRIGAMATVNLAYSLAFSFGAVIAAVLLSDPARELHGLVSLALGFSLASFALALAAFPRQGRRPARRSLSPEPQNVQAPQCSVVPSALTPGGLLVALGAISLAYAAMDTSIALWSTVRWGWQAGDFVLVYIAGGGAAALSQIALMAWPLVDREAVLARFGLVCLAAGLLLLLLSSVASMVYGAAFLMGGGTAVAVSALQALLSQRYPASRQGRAMGNAQAVVGLAWVAGPLFSAFSLAVLGPAWPFMAGLLVLGLALPGLMGLGWPDARSFWPQFGKSRR